MPTKRTPLNRTRRRRIPAEAMEAFRRGLAGDPHAERDLRRALGLAPWHISPSDPGLDGPKPPYLQASNLCAAATWAPAIELRAALRAAAGDAL